VPESPKRKLRETTIVSGKPHSLGSRLGLQSSRRYTRAQKPEAVGNTPHAQKPEAVGNTPHAQKPGAVGDTPVPRSPKRELRDMRAVTCKRPAVWLVGASNAYQHNVHPGLPCPTASNKKPRAGAR